MSRTELQQAIVGVNVDVCGGGVGVFGGVCQRLGHQVVGGDLDGLGRHPGHLDFQLYRKRAAAGQLLDRCAQSAFAQDRRVDAPRDFVYLHGYLGQARGDARHLFSQLSEVGRRQRFGRARVKRQRHQALLGAVVQIAFDAAALTISGRHDPFARGDQLGIELGVVQGDRQLAGDEFDRIEPLGRERGADEPVLQHQQRLQRAAVEVGTASSAQQSTSAK